MTIPTTNEKKRVRIIRDDSPESPREKENLGRMVCWHKRYILGDEQPRQAHPEYLQQLAIAACPRLGQIIEHWDGSSWDWLVETLPNVNCVELARSLGVHISRLVSIVLERHYIILPLFLLDDDSCITMRTSCRGSRACDPVGRDWEEVGYVYCTKAKGIEKCGSEEQARRRLQAEVEVYDHYLRGDVYRFVVEVRRHCDECEHEEWETIDCCGGFFGRDIEKNGLLDHLDKDLHELARAAEVEYA